MKPEPEHRDSFLPFLLHVGWALLCLLVAYALIFGSLDGLRIRFERVSSEFAAGVEHKLVANDAVLSGFAAFLQAVEQDDRVSTARYADAVKAAHPQISTLEVARKVRHAELASFEDALRRSWNPGFAVHDFAGASLEQRGDTGPEDPVWPIIFIHPEVREADKIYGVRLETVGYLSRTLDLASPGQNVASPVFQMLQGEPAYILLRHIVRPSAERAGKQLNFFGTSMVAMLVIKTALLFPQSMQDNITLGARLETPGFAAGSVLAQRSAQQATMTAGKWLPRFEKRLEIGPASQRVTLDFAQQAYWQDIFDPATLALLILVAGIYFLAVHLSFRHRSSLSLARRSLERLSYAQKTAGAGLWDWDLANGRQSWSDEFFHLCGLDPAVHKPGYRSWYQAVHPDDRKAAARVVARALHDGTALFNQYRIVLPNAQVRWVEAYGQVIHDQRGIPIRMSGMCIDVTRRKVLEIERERYKRFFESASELMAMVSADGIRLTVNPAFARALGYSESELRGKHFGELVHPEDRQAMIDRIGKLVEHGGTETFINRYVCRDGSVRWLSWNSTYRPEENAIYSVARDTTEQRAVEAALLDAKEAAERASRTKSEFLAAVSHDLRQPAVAISLFADALGKSSLEEEQRGFVSNIERGAKSLNEMLNLLLSVARLDAGTLEARLETFSSGDLFAWIEHDFAKLFLARQLRFKLHFPARDLMLKTDRGLLKEILRNLIGNALKYTAAGGVLVALRRRGGQALIQVWDTGIGIAPEHLDRIFDEYYQVGNRERDSDKGVGLGLTIVARKAALIGAQVNCRSRSGRGSVFELLVPLADR